MQLQIYMHGLGDSVVSMSDWWSGGRMFDPSQVGQHFFMEIDHEIFPVIILSLWFKKDSCQFLAKECVQKTG